MVMIIEPDINVRRYLDIIAESLGMEYRYYIMKTKKQDVVELRFIAALLLRQYAQGSLRDIGKLWGYQHDVVLNMVSKAIGLLEVRDKQFTEKYLTAVLEVTKYSWRMQSKSYENSK